MFLHLHKRILSWSRSDSRSFSAARGLSCFSRSLGSCKRGEVPLSVQSEWVWDLKKSPEHEKVSCFLWGQELETNPQSLSYHKYIHLDSGHLHQNGWIISMWIVLVLRWFRPVEVNKQCFWGSLLDHKHTVNSYRACCACLECLCGSSQLLIR